MNEGYDIYYAHHQWKYGTKLEQYELDLIRRYFPKARICNPATDIDNVDRSEEDIMRDCLDTVKTRTLSSSAPLTDALDGVFIRKLRTRISTIRSYSLSIMTS